MKRVTIRRIKERLSYFNEYNINLKSYQIAYQGKHVPHEAPSLTNYCKLNGFVKNNETT